MNLKDKIVLAHKGYFNKESEKSYRENSKELCVITTTKDYIKIIELDVRKSKDGILYCYHGRAWEYFTSLRFSHNFYTLREKYKVDTLEEVLEVITEDKSILLDIKSRNITKEDILNTVGNKNFKEVIIGHSHVSFLKRFDGMPERFVKMLMGDILSPLYDLKKLKEKNFKYLDVVFPFQTNKRIMEECRLLDIEFGCFPVFFWNQKSFWEKVDKYGIRKVQSDFM